MLHVHSSYEGKYPKDVPLNIAPSADMGGDWTQRGYDGRLDPNRFLGKIRSSAVITGDWALRGYEGR